MMRSYLLVEKAHTGKIIFHSTGLGCNSHEAFEFFAVNEHLEKWLTKVADVKPEVGGKYELFWNPEDGKNDSTVGYRILAIAEDRFLCLSGRGP